MLADKALNRWWTSPHSSNQLIRGIFFRDGRFFFTKKISCRRSNFQLDCSRRHRLAIQSCPKCLQPNASSKGLLELIIRMPRPSNAEIIS